MRALFILFLVGANVLVYANAFPNRDLVVHFLDVGQGDAILIEGPTGVQMLIDGGPDTSVMRALGRALPFYDRTIDIVVATHPDKDHIGGLVDVIERYNVHAYIGSSVKNDTTPTRALEGALATRSTIKQWSAMRGMRVILGGGAYADILFPDRVVDALETNTGSVIMRVVYGSTEFLLTGDAPSSIEKYLVSLDGEKLKSDVLKAGHHGSRTSTSPEFIEKVNPDIVVVSAGKENSYGHPHSEVLETIEESGAQTLTTIDRGTIIFRSFGYALEY